MIYLVYILFGFAVIQLLVALINFLFREMAGESKSSCKDLLSVLIPARNEEANIGNLLEDLINQEYKNIEIIVYNDQSEDSTETIILNYINKDNRIKLISSEGLPGGWLGKNHACHVLSTHARGNYFLFLDADVSVKKDFIKRAIAFFEKKHLGLLSYFPSQLVQSIGEKFTVPLMNYILLTLLPLVLVRITRNPSLAAANGQFMLFSREHYLALKPHEFMKNNKVEDIAIARYFKKKRIPVACLLGDSNLSCRMYMNYNEAINGFSKNITAFFGDSFLVSLAFWLITTWGFVIVFALISWKIGVIYLLIILSTRVLVSIASYQNVLENIMYLIPQQLSCGQIIYKAFLYKIRKGYQWKGRSLE